jgi:hypothetical protein
MDEGGMRMWIFRWEFFAVGALWTLASVMFKQASKKGESSGKFIAAGLGLTAAGIVLLVVRFGLHHT